MAFTEQEKRRIIAITRKLREDKGIVIRKSDLDQDLARVKSSQDNIVKSKKLDTSKEHAAKADESTKKLQEVIDNLNEYMSVLHSANLIEIDVGGSDLKAAIASG
jgi:hypothetical protein